MNEPVRYFQSIDSPLGILGIAATEAGVTSISFENSAQIPTTEVRSNAHTIKACEQLRAYFEGKRTSFSLPLVAKGTPFEQSVWEKLLFIPFATTTTYGGIATELGKPGAMRAVGLANGKNPIAIVVPCHRVIGSNGKLTGYGGELWRKQWLLDHEARVAGTRLF